MKYYLGTWQWLNNPMPHFGVPAGAIGAIDLGTLPQMVASGTGRGGCLCWTAGGTLPSEYTLLGDGDCRELHPDAGVRSAFQSLIGYRPKGNTLAECIYDCLLGGADVDGQTGPLPLVPGIDGWMDLWMPGHSRVLSERFEWGRTGSRGSNHTPKLKQMLRKQFAKLFDDAQAGKLKDNQHHRRVLDNWCEKFAITDWQEFVPANLQAKVSGRLKHETTINENFDQSDSTTLGPQLSWTEVNGDWRTVGNSAGKSTTDNTVQLARADSDLSSADHYAQIKRLTTGIFEYQGPSARVDASGAMTFYTFWSDGTSYLTKLVAGSQTVITSGTLAIAANDVYKVECNGSTIKGYCNGTQNLSATDTSITGNLRCGINIYKAIDSAIDDFQAADLSAAPGILYTQLENWPRGVERGVYSRQGG